MTQEKLSELVEENLKTIFAYALSRVSRKEDAEDLAGDIILAILQNGTRIRDDNAFFGYIWAIAANTYKKFLRKKSHMQYELLDEELADEADFTREILKSQEFHVLRRELSLLSREYRECTVAYYFEGLSCAETASRLCISLEMVKYYLFKTRKILKEGISMEREFGTKSYNPVKFEFRPIFSGSYNEEYRNLFSRKLPGNILVSVYYTPMTIRELAIEMGVASAYLEDEIALLEKYRLLTPLPGGKYQSCLVIFTEDFRKEFYKTAEKTLAEDMGVFISKVKEKLPAVRALNFPGSELEDACLIWAILFECIRKGWHLFRSALGEKGRESELYRGATGINCGYTYESCSETDEYSSYSFAGYKSLDRPYAACYADFGIIPLRNRPSSFFEKLTENLDGVLGGFAEALVPVFTREQKNALETILQKEIEKLAEIYGSLYQTALAVMRVHVPGHMALLVENVLVSTLFYDTVGLVGLCAVRSGELSVPDTDSPLGVFLYET